MDRNDPALFFPEWLRGARQRPNQSGKSGVQIISRNRLILHPKRSAVIKTDHNTPRNSALADGEFSTYSKTSSSCNGVKRYNNNYDRDSGFYRNPSFSRYEEVKSEVKSDRDVQFHDCKISQEREREQNVGGRVGNKRYKRVNGDDKGRDCKQFGTSHHGSSSRAQCIFEEKKLLEGTAKYGRESPDSLLPHASFGSIVDKVAFERDFPFLGTETKHASFNLYQGNIGQGQVGRSDSGRPLLGLSIQVGLSHGTSGKGISAAGANGQVSSLVDIPISTMGLSRSNGFSTLAEKIAHGSLFSSMQPGSACAGGDNMVSTSAQNPPQICASPKVSAATQNREELSLKQSRQLVPLTCTLPKNMAAFQSEKSRSKLLKHARFETVSSGGKVQQPLGSFHQNPSVRSPQKLKFKKPTQGENPLQGGNFGIKSFDASNARESNVRSTSSIADSTGLEAQSKPRSLALDDKKSVLQNRNEFFNALRKKASGSLLMTRKAQDKSTLSTGQKMDELTGKSLVGNKLLNDVKRNGFPDESPDKYKKDLTVEDEVHKKNSTVNCSIFGNSSICPKDIDKSGCPAPMNDTSFIRWSEEEEIAFMRSLGWDENAEEEPLTAEEINEFYKKYKTALNALLQDNRWQGNRRLHLENMIRNSSL